jgi:uncharacterized cupin superfamily protein
LAQAERTAGGAQRTMPGHRKEHTDIVPIHIADGAGRSAPVLWCTAEFGADDWGFIERNHDTILYRHISVFSISDIKTYRYALVEIGFGDRSRDMATIIDLTAELAKLTMLRDRTPQTTRAERQGSSRNLAEYRDGAVFTTSFSGEGGWERHRNGEEIVHILNGDTTLHLMTEKGPETPN